MRSLLSARLGADFSKLWTASLVSNLGDGVAAAAGPLLVASVTEDPALIGGAAFVQQLPWLLFSLISGAYADRLDRRRLVVAAIVEPDRLPVANARMFATHQVVNQFVARPLGAWLFVVAAAVPFGVNALSFAVSAMVVATIRPIPAPRSGPRRSLRAEIGAGLRWLWEHRLLRTLAVSMGLANVAFCAAFATFVLYARHRLGLSDVGFGVLLTTFAVGGLLGTALAPWLQEVFGAGALLRVGLVVEVVTHATLAVTTAPLDPSGVRPHSCRRMKPSPPGCTPP